MWGLGGSWGNGTFPVSLMWYGPDGSNFIETSTEPDPANEFASWFRGLRLACPNSPATRYGHGILVNNRGDLGWRMDEMWIQHGYGNGVRFMKGGINTHLRNFRVDQMGNYAVYWKVFGNDVLSLADFTHDTGNAASTAFTTSGWGTVDADGLTSVSSFNLSIQAARIEINRSLAADQALIKLQTNPAFGSKVLHHLSIGPNVSVAHAPTMTGNSILVTPTTDFVDVTIYPNAQVPGIVGVPHIVGGKGGSGGRRGLTRIMPHHIAHQTSPSSDHQSDEFYSLVNFRGHVYMHDTQASLITQINPTSLPAGTTVQVGDRFETVSGTTVTEYRCRVAGTVGTLSGVTATGTSGTSSLTVNTVTGLKTAQLIVVDGVTYRITGIFGTTVTTHINLTTSPAASAVTYLAPTFLTRAETWI